MNNQPEINQLEVPSFILNYRECLARIENAFPELLDHINNLRSFLSIVYMSDLSIEVVNKGELIITLPDALKEILTKVHEDQETVNSLNLLTEFILDLTDSYIFADKDAINKSNTSINLILEAQLHLKALRNPSLESPELIVKVSVEKIRNWIRDKNLIGNSARRVQVDIITSFLRIVESLNLYGHNLIIEPNKVDELTRMKIFMESSDSFYREISSDLLYLVEYFKAKIEEIFETFDSKASYAMLLRDSLITNETES